MSPARERAWIETINILLMDARMLSPARERAWIETRNSADQNTGGWVARS